MNKNYRNFLIIILDNEPIFSVSEKQPDNKFRYKNTTFNTTQELGNVFFYDWIRNEKSEIVGVQTFPMEDDGLKEFIKNKKLDYVEVKENGPIQIFIRDNNDINWEWSADQLFSHSKYYIGEQKNLAFSFELPELSDKEEPYNLSEKDEQWFQSNSSNIELI